MIKIVAIGKVKEKAMNELIAEYQKRLKPISQVMLIELPNRKKQDTDIQGIIEDESDRILSKTSPQDYVILLDLKGKDLSSEKMSEHVMGVLDTSKPIVFIIGGSHGVSDEIRNRANYRWRISNLTFPHQLVRLMLYEQIYRIFMISKNHPYHK